MTRLSFVSLLEPVHPRRSLRARAAWLGWGVAAVLAVALLVLARR